MGPAGVRGLIEGAARRCATLRDGLVTSRPLLHDRWDDDVVDRDDVRAARIGIAHVLRVEANAYVARLLRSPAPHGETERLTALDLVAAVIALALRLEVVTNEIEARVLELSGPTERLPSLDRTGAVERHVG